MATKRIFITGGASGFGKALALRWAREGWDVLIGDIHEQRGEETLEALRKHPGRMAFLRCDVTRDADLEAARDWLRDNWGGVDVVVNNAGVGVGGGIADTPMDDWRWIVDINLLGVVRGCRVFTPVFRAQGGGTFLNVASLAGLVHAPLMSAYNATKAAVVAISETLAVELEPDGIHTSVICPSFFRTNLTETMRVSNDEVRGLTDSLINDARYTADEIADYVYKAVQRKEFRILPHLEGRAAWALKRSSPWPVWAAAVAKAARFMLKDKR